MLASNPLHLTGKGIKPDTREFVRQISLKLLNILENRGLDTKAVEVLATNDVYAFRGTSVVVICFSRSRRLPQPILSEMLLSEVIRTESTITVDQPSLFTVEGWDEFMCGRMGCVSPVSIVFPIAYLSMQGSELEQAHEKTATLLVRPAEEDIDRKKRIVKVDPIYTGRDYLIEADLCFVLMEFEPPYTDIYQTLIGPTVREQGMRCLKSDDIFTTTSVIEDIWANINKAFLVIAEISTNNPNVMYELGICHTVGKNVMMITQDPDLIPFNFRHMRCYPYTNDIPGSDGLKKNIRSVIQHLKATSLG